jgi:plastocyanin
VVEQLASSYPDRFAPITYHVNGDPYTVAWAQTRLDGFYGLGGAVPTFAVDGTWICSTSDYQYWVEQELGQPTDVTIEMSGTLVQGSTWDVTARVCVESGSSRPLRVHTAATLNHYPSPPHYTINNLMQTVVSTDISLGAGDCSNVTNRITFDAVSASDPSNIVVVAWAEAPSVSAPTQVYQAALMRWPFPAGSYLSGIDVSPASVTLEVGDSIQLSATGRDQHGASYPLTNPTWSLGTGMGDGTFDPPTGATTTFTATSAGSRQLLCTESGVTGAAVATITEPPVLTTIVIDPASTEVSLGDDVTFTASGRDQFGASFPLAGPAWSVSGDGNGSFNPAAGVTTAFTASAVGACTVSATEGGVTGTAEVDVIGEPPYLATISVSPATATIRVGGTLDLTAAGADQYGDPFALSSPTWRVEGDGDGSFDPTSGAATTFTASAVGTVQLICAEDGVEGEAAVTINNAGLPAPRKVTKRVAP